MKKNSMAFLFGLGSVTQIRIVGSMTITEAVCIGLIPFIAKKNWSRLKSTRGIQLSVWLLLWGISGIITDLYRETPINDSLRGLFALPFLFSMFLCAFALLWDNLTRVKWITLGMLFSGIISIYYFRNPSLIYRAELYRVDAVNLIDFRNTYASVILYLVFFVTLVFYKKYPFVVSFLLLIVSAIYLAQGSRGMFLRLFICSLGARVATNYSSAFKYIQRNVLVLLALLGVLVVVATEIYAYSAKGGWLGDAALSKYERQSESEIGLLSGRGGFFAAMLVVADSPIIGLGSWAKDTKGYTREYMEMVGDREGVEYMRLSGKQPLAPAHSHIMQAWVWHGFLGAAFWIVVFLMIIKYFRYALHLCRPMIAYNLLIITTATWNLFFTPFGQRPFWGVVFAILVLSLAEEDRRRKRLSAGENVNLEASWDGKWKS